MIAARAQKRPLSALLPREIASRGMPAGAMVGSVAKVGRPSKLDKCAAQFLKHIEAGQPIASAAALSGLAQSTVFAWLADARENPSAKLSEFLESFTRARGKAQAKLVREIRSAGREDWRATGWLLERMFPEQFNLRSNDPAVSVNVNATANAIPPSAAPNPAEFKARFTAAQKYLEEHRGELEKPPLNRFGNARIS